MFKPLSSLKYFTFFSLLFFFKGYAGEDTVKSEGLNSNMLFIENKGQVVDMNHRLRPDILYVGEGGNAKIYLRKGGVSYVMSRFGQDKTDDSKKSTKERILKIKTQELSLCRIDLDFLGSNAVATILADKQTNTYFNYYLGSCPNGIANVHAFNKVVYQNIYKNIDVAWYGGKRAGAKYDIIVRPGGDPNKIKIEYKGIDGLQITDEGELKITNSLGDVVEQMPKVYQNINGKIVDIAAKYILNGTIVNFKLSNFDHNYPLVIDPWVTYCGGTGDENAGGIAVDRNGNSVITGCTSSPDFPISPGAFQTINSGNYDVLITKYDPTGNRIWSTYYGGVDADRGSGVAINTVNEIVVTGSTGSADFPVSVGAFQTNNIGSGNTAAFVLKLNSNGIRSWATYYGGEGDIASRVATDAGDNIFITGATSSLNFPVSSGAFQTGIAGGSDSYIVKFDPAGNRLWGTYFGGNGEEYGTSIATDLNGNVVITGFTGSTDLPFTTGAFQTSFAGGTNGMQDGFVAKFNPNGNRLWATYYGGSGDDEPEGVAIDSFDNVVVTGYTDSPNFPVTPGAFQTTLQNTPPWGNSFAVKFNSSGNRLWATYFGIGIPYYFIPGGCVIDEYNNIYVLIEVEDINPGNVFTCGFQKTSSGIEDQVITKFGPNGNHLCDTYLGGPLEDELESGGGIAYHKGSVFVTVSTPGGYPVTSGASQTNFGGGPNDIAVAVFCGMNCGDPTPLGNVDFGWNQTPVCTSAPVNFTDQSANLNICDSIQLTYAWTFSNGTPSTSTDKNPSGIVYNTAGNFSVKLILYNPCGVDSATKTITINSQPVLTVSSNTTICSGTNATLTASGATGYIWQPGTISGNSIVVSPTSNNTYTVTGTDASGCSNTALVTLTVNSLPSLTVSADTIVCDGSASTLFVGGASNYSWNTGSTNNNILVSPTIATSYSVVGTNSNNCTAMKQINVAVNQTPQLTASDDTTICEGQSLTLTASGATSYVWSTGTSTASINIYPVSSSGYTVSAANGPCTSTEIINVTVLSIPIVGAGNNVTIQSGSSVALSGSGSGNYLWTPGSGLSCNTCQYPIADPIITTTYYLTVTDAAGCYSIDSVTVFVEILCNDLFVPTAFSPNNDGQNDVFKIQGNCITTLHLTIFNRWGELVFESNNLTDAWNGRYKEKDLDADVFTYYFEAELVVGGKIIKHGNVSLIK